MGESPGYVLHELRELEETLGTLLIAIIRDPDGLELCLVSSEVFDPAVRAAADFAMPKWDARRKLAAERENAESSAEGDGIFAPSRPSPGDASHRQSSEL